MAGLLAAVGKAAVKMAPQGLALAANICAAAGAPPGVTQGLAAGANGAAQLKGIFGQIGKG